MRIAFFCVLTAGFSACSDDNLQASCAPGQGSHDSQEEGDETSLIQKSLLQIQRAGVIDGQRADQGEYKNGLDDRQTVERMIMACNAERQLHKEGNDTKTSDPSLEDLKKDWTALTKAKKTFEDAKDKYIEECIKKKTAADEAAWNAFVGGGPDAKPATPATKPDAKPATPATKKKS